jgi:vacuolar-type H+-ATPase subunit I/STV1
LGEVAALLAQATDEVSRISRRLEELGIVHVIKSGIEERFTLGDHLKIETLPRDDAPPAMQDEVQRLKAQKESKLQELESLIKKGPAKPDLFQELDKALKDPSSRKKPNPLD